MDNKTQVQELSEQLRIEGINCKGFGIVSKFVMLDTDLSLCAKTIYAYLCSLAGNGATSFPRRKTIMHHLNISKTAYYKHFNLLLEQGYIRADRAGTFPFGNIYTIVSNPKKLQTVKLPDENSSSSRLKHTGLKSLGFGVLPRALMMDDRISWQSKGIYAYFCSYVGGGVTAFPSRDLIQYQLGISVNTYHKHFRQLIEVNYISVQQRKQGGRYGVNDYFLNDLPDEAVGAEEVQKRKLQKSPSTSFKDNGTTPENTAFSPSTNIKDNEEPPQTTSTSPSTNFEDNVKFLNTNFQDNSKWHHKNDDNYNINRTTKNNSNKTNPSIMNSRIEGIDEKIKSKQIIKDRESYRKVILKNIEYSVLKSKNDDKITPFLDMLVETMLDAITSTAPMLRVNGSEMPQELVKSRLLKLDESHIEFVCLGLHESKTKIKSLKNYVLTALYNSTTNIDLYYTQWVKHDMAR